MKKLKKETYSLFLYFLVVTLIGVCTKDSLCLVTEYQPKGSLRTYLDTNAKIELPDIIKFCLDICAGM